MMLLVSEAGGLPWYVRTKVSLTALEADCEMKVSGTGQCLPGLPFSVACQRRVSPSVLPFHGHSSAYVCPAHFIRNQLYG